MKSYPDPNPPALATIDAQAADAAAEQTRFDQVTARRAEMILSALEARLVQIRRPFIKICLAGCVQSCASNPKI